MTYPHLLLFGGCRGTKGFFGLNKETPYQPLRYQQAVRNIC
uniref:Uncharacterized protein n=1 Tax=Anguilla anguilla TaxID=7936 RepID=A0A0E9THU5_ANGAN